MRNKLYGFGVAGMCLLLASHGYSAKNDAKSDASRTNSPGSADKNPWGDPRAIAAMAGKFTPEEKALRKRQVEQIEAFAAAKEKQAEKLASLPARIFLLRRAAFLMRRSEETGREWKRCSEIS